MVRINEVTLGNAKEYIRSLEILEGDDIKDPIGYLTGEIAKLEKKLADFEKGEGDLPAGMNQEEAIKQLSGVVAYQRAYLALYQKEGNSSELLTTLGES